MLRAVTSDKEADVRIYLLEARAGAEPDDPLPQIGHVAEPTWAVVGRDGRLMMPLHSLSEAESKEIVVANLEKEAKYRQALAVRNPSLASPLAGKVDLKLLRQGADGNWIEAEAEDAGGEIIYQEEDR
jgi:hypothetical protein